MTEVQKLAAFVAAARYDQISSRALEQLKIRVLDTLGVAIGALDAGPTRAIRKLTEALGGNGDATLIGGGHTAPDRAAFYNTALSRYLDFMDSYLAPGETCHPSDNIGSVLAAAESVDATGKQLLTAVAVAYQVHTRLSDVAPVRARGFDHTVQGAYAPERITRPDVQALLDKISITPEASFSARFPAEMATQVSIDMQDGTHLSASATGFLGFTSQPLDWAAACAKFNALVTPFIDAAAARQIADCVHELDSHRVRELTALLANVPLERRRDVAVQVA